MDKFPLSWTTPHVHRWIDPDAPPVRRVNLREVIGEGPREMKGGHVYRCRHCGEELEIPARFKMRES